MVFLSLTFPERLKPHLISHHIHNAYRSCTVCFVPDLCRGGSQINRNNGNCSKIQALFTQCLVLGCPLITTGCLAFRSKLGSLPIAQYLLLPLELCQYLDLGFSICPAWRFDPTLELLCANCYHYLICVHSVIVLWICVLSTHFCAGCVCTCINIFGIGNSGKDHAGFT